MFRMPRFAVGRLGTLSIFISCACGERICIYPYIYVHALHVKCEVHAHVYICVCPCDILQTYVLEHKFADKRTGRENLIHQCY